MSYIDILYAIIIILSVVTIVSGIYNIFVTMKEIRNIDKRKQ